MRSLQVVLLLGLGCVLGDPDVFENYFDDELRYVDVPEEAVLKACLANGDDTVKKIQKAYDKCFGEDYSFEDLANTVGRDSDNDDLPDEYEGNEACFYKTMDWVKGKEVQPSVIEADMAGLPDFDSFKDNINACSAWSGNFGGRKKRAVGDASQDTEEVPSVMESGSGALQWVKSLVRRARSAEPGKKGEKKQGNSNRRMCKKGKNCKNGRPGKNGKKGRGKKTDKERRMSQRNSKCKGKNCKRGKNGRNGRGKRPDKGKGKEGRKERRRNNRNGNVKCNGKGKNGKKCKSGQKGGNGKKGSRNRKDKNGNNGRKGRKGGEKNEGKKGEKIEGNKGAKNKGQNGGNNRGRSGKSSDLLPEFVYNKLWCFDLAMEQALEKCVEDKLNN